MAGMKKTFCDIYKFLHVHRIQYLIVQVESLAVNPLVDCNPKPVYVCLKKHLRIAIYTEKIEA